MRSAGWVVFGVCVALGGAAGCQGDTAEPGGSAGSGAGGGPDAQQAGEGNAPGGEGNASAGSAGEGGSSARLQGGAAGAADGGGGSEPEPGSIEALIADYTAWHALSAPYDVTADILSLCRTPTANEDAFLESEHAGFALRHWANDQALYSIQQDMPFLEGAAIVKEKLGYVPSTVGTEVMALGVMVKRQAGFDASSGDWQFAYYTAADGVLSDAATQTACASCHASGSAKDFVFLDGQWRLGEDFP